MVVDGQQVYCQIDGEGPPVLLLHGNPDTSRIWGAVVEQLRGRYRCVAPDLPGLGRSQICPDGFDFTLSGLARWVDAVATAVAPIELINLVVHDFGGIFGLAWAVRHPDKVRSVAIINTLFQADYRWHFWARIWRTRGLGELSMRMFSVPVLGRASARLSMKIGSRKLSLAEIDRTFDEFAPSTRSVVLRLYRATDPENFVGWENDMVALNRRLPSLVLWGDHDPYIPKSFAERFGAREVVHFPDCGHWLPSEAPELVGPHLLRLFG
jgi:haloalkane dehalogenase